MLRALPGVKDAHVPGVPDDARGATVAALIVGIPGEIPDPDRIAELAREKLSNYKAPRYVVTVTEDELPWLATGKPDRQAIGRLLAERGPSATSVE